MFCCGWARNKKLKAIKFSANHNLGWEKSTSVYDEKYQRSIMHKKQLEYREKRIHAYKYIHPLIYMDSFARP